MNATLIRTDRNGTKYFEGLRTCPRCGGAGGSNAWAETGWTCYECGGRGETFQKWVEYTPEHEAKLEAQRKRRAAKKLAEWEKREAEREAERKEREERERKEREAAEEAERIERAKSNFVGNIGDKIVISATYMFTAWYDFRDPFGREERMYIHTFKDEHGNVLVWKTQSFNAFFANAETDTPVTLSGTIKAHDEYKGQKQTRLIRCKVAA